MSDSYDNLIEQALADAEQLEEAVVLDLSDSDLLSLSILSGHMLRLEDVIENLAALTEKANESLTRLREQLIPDAMTKNGLKLIELSDGSKLSVAMKYIGSITKDNEDAALAWFKSSGRVGVVTPQLSVLTQKGHLDEAEKIAKSLIEQGIPCTLKPSVHWQTLRAVVRELYETGTEIPSCISTHVISQATIKRKK